MTKGNDGARRVSTPTRLRGKTSPDTTGLEAWKFGHAPSGRWAKPLSNNHSGSPCALCVFAKNFPSSTDGKYMTCPSSRVCAIIPAYNLRDTQGNEFRKLGTFHTKESLLGGPQNNADIHRRSFCGLSPTLSFRHVPRPPKGFGGRTFSFGSTPIADFEHEKRLLLYWLPLCLTVECFCFGFGDTDLG